MHVIIVGAGLMGLTTAFFLRRAGVEVTVVDRQSGPGLETSFANGGMLHASQANPWNEPGVLWTALRMIGREDAALLLRPRALPGMWRWGLDFVRHSRPAHYLRNFERNAHLARYSLSEMEGIRGVVGGDYDAQRSGTMKLFRTAQEVAGAARLCAQLGAWGIQHQVIDAAGAVAREPALAPIEGQLAGGLFFPQDESGDARRFCALLADWLQAQGVHLRYGLGVRSLRPRQGRSPVVVTMDGELESDAVVLAAGSYSPQLAKGVGLRLPVVPVKGYSLTLPLNGWEAGPRVPVIDDHLHAAVCPLGDRLRVAGTAEFAGYDLELTPTRINNLFDLVTKLYPAFRPWLDPNLAIRWTGLRPMSSDGVGIMGPTRVPGLFLNTGHGHLGWTMAAGAGHLVADEITEQRPALPAGFYHLSRFSPASRG